MIKFSDDVPHELISHSKMLHSLLYAAQEVASSISTADPLVLHLLHLVELAEREAKIHVADAEEAMSKSEQLPSLVSVSA